MDHSDPVIPDFADVFGAPSGPVDRAIRRINSAHQPEVRDVASDNEIGRAIVEDDARKLAVQKRTVRKQVQRKLAPSVKPPPDDSA